MTIAMTSPAASETAGQLPAEITAQTEFSLSVVQALKEAKSRIVPAGSARRMWERLLTPGERRELGDDFESRYRELGTIGIWRRLKSCPQHRAVLDVAYGIEFLTEPTYRWLLRETEGAAVASEAASTEQTERPDWNRENGTFSWRGQTVAQFDINTPPSQLDQILSAFQQADWAVRVANPLAELLTQQVAQALRYLNQRLRVIRIHAQESSCFLRWEVVAKESA